MYYLWLPQWQSLVTTETLWSAKPKRFTFCLIHACWLGALPPALFCVGFFWDRVSRTICPGLALNCDPPDLCKIWRSWPRLEGQGTFPWGNDP
jgi:hypothetical protein